MWVAAEAAVLPGCFCLVGDLLGKWQRGTQPRSQRTAEAAVAAPKQIYNNFF